MTDPKLGATGTYPDGKLGPNDEGGLTYSVGSSLSDRIVIINFGKPVHWLGLPPAEARELAMILLQHAGRLDGSVTQVHIEGSSPRDKSGADPA